MTPSSASSDDMSEHEDLRAGSDLLALLASAPAEPEELRGEMRVLDAYRASVMSPVKSSSSRPRPWRPLMLAPALSAKLAALVGAGAVSVGGLAAAAYAGTLPDTAQNFAHHAIGAPAAPSESESHKAAPSSTPVGPDASGQAAFGLCTAWDKVKDHGKAAEKAVAFRNLATAAGGEDKIAGYCATVPHSGATASSSATSHPTSAPTTPEPSSRPSVPPIPTEAPSEATSNPGSSHRP